MARGAVIALIGGSGTGKSVLLREIIGLLRPQAGRIELFGQSVWNATPAQMNALRRRFGVLFQDGALFSSLSVEDNVATPLFEHTDLPHATCRQLARLKLALAGLPADTAGKRPSELSGGMRKRVALARALALDPELLFLDEPTSGLDPISARAFDSLIRLLADSLGLTVFLVTHDLDTLFSIIDRVIVLSDGRVLGSGTLAELKQSTIRGCAITSPHGRRMEKPRMETEGRYTLVGTLVLAVIALMTLAIVWLVGAADQIAYQTYTIYFKQQSLDGLAVGSPVKMRGIKVGVVDSYRFAQGDDEAVSVTARIDEGVPVHTGAAAYIKRNLVTGIAAVEINNGPSNSALLSEIPRGERYPVIAEGSSDLDKVATAISRLAVSGAQVLEKMDTLLSENNQHAISQTSPTLTICRPSRRQQAESRRRGTGHPRRRR